jgi:hypothetical protein
LAAGAAREQAVTLSTHQERHRYWGYYLTYLNKLGLGRDPFLRGFHNHADRAHLLSAFAGHYQRGLITGNVVKAGTVRKALDAVAAVFRQNEYPSPCHSEGATFPRTQLHPRLEQQLKGLSNQDTPATPQKALTPAVYRALATQNASDEDIATHQLFRGAFFFAMRSCEYLETVGSRRTKRLCLRNLRFFQHNTEWPHTHRHLHLAATISITFEFQKNQCRNEVITMHRTTDPILCPVLAWATLVQR